MSVALPSLDEVAASLDASVSAKAAVVSTENPEEAAPPPSEENPAAPTPEGLGQPNEGENPAPAPVVPAAPEKRDSAAARFAALSRREREARERANEADRRAKEVEAREVALRERETKVTSAKSPMEVLKAHGFSYSDATMEAVGAYKPKEIDPADAKLDERLAPVDAKTKELEEKLAQVDSLLTQLQTVQVNEMEIKTRRAIQETAATKGYEYVSAMGEEGVDLVYNYLSEVYTKHKKILTFEQACERIESYFEERANKLATTPKMQSRFAPTAVPPSGATKQSNQSQAKAPAKTLTQSLSQGNKSKVDVDKLPARDALEYLAKNVIKFHPD